EPAHVVVELAVDADFADLFEVKEGRVRHTGSRTHEVTADRLRIGHHDQGASREVTITWSRPAEVEPVGATWRATLAPRERWEVRLEVTVAVDGRPIMPRFAGIDEADTSEASARLTSRQATLPLVDTDHPTLRAVVARSGEDLGSLRIFDPDHPDD